MLSTHHYYCPRTVLRLYSVVNIIILVMTCEGNNIIDMSAWCNYVKNRQRWPAGSPKNLPWICCQSYKRTTSFPSWKFLLRKSWIASQRATEVVIWKQIWKQITGSWLWKGLGNNCYGWWKELRAIFVICMHTIRQYWLLEWSTEQS